MNTTDSPVFPIVCVGSSAGGLEPLLEFVENLPSDIEAAIVIVNHRRRIATLLHEILPRHTQIPVEMISDRLNVVPNRIFIIPTNRELYVLDGEFYLNPISKAWGWPDVITKFLHSLAQNWKGTLIAVIASGLDADGAAALSDIKSAGGITFAQKPNTALYSDMPESAIDTGCVDFILTAKEIARTIAEITATSKPTSSG